MIIYEPRRHRQHNFNKISEAHKLWIWAIRGLHSIDSALRHCMFYTRLPCGDRHVHQKKKSMWPYPHPSERPLQQYMLLSPIPTFYVLQCVIYAAVSMSKQAKANSPAESPQMHTESSPRCHTHIAQPLSAARRLEPPKLPPFPRCAAAHGRQLLIWKCYENKT